MSAAGVIRGRIEWDMRQRVAKLGYNTYPLGRWIREVDNSAYMLRCPDCDGRVVAENYLLAVGGYGTRHCPYCGSKMVEYSEDDR